MIFEGLGLTADQAFVCGLQTFWFLGVFMHFREGSLQLSHPQGDPAQTYFCIVFDLEELIWSSPNESPELISPEEGRKVP